MKTLLYIGLDFHRKTKSSEFILDLLGERYSVLRCDVDPTGEDPYSLLKAMDGRSFDVVLCFQVMPPRELLDRYITYSHGVLVPMYDGCPKVAKTEKWYPYRDFQIICFCCVLAENLIKSGFSAKAIQYYPVPAVRPIWGNATSVFFWYRRKRININLVDKICGRLGVDHIHLHNAPDPGQPRFDPPENSAIRYTESVWFETRDELLRVIEESALYIAPRPLEGIGMSFLEAMAMGKCIIAPNSPTMNEYIIHGYNGLLYDMDDPQPLPSFEIRRIQENAYQSIMEGHRQWIEKRTSILDWIEEAPVSISRRVAFFMARRFFRNPVKVGRVLKSEQRRRRNG